MGAVAVTAAPANILRTKRDRSYFNGYRGKWATLTLSSSYSTGGDTLAPASFGLSRVYGVLVAGNEALTAAAQRSGTTVTAVVTTPTAPTLKAYATADTEASAASNQSGVSVVAFVYGV